MEHSVTEKSETIVSILPFKHGWCQREGISQRSAPGVPG